MKLQKRLSRNYKNKYYYKYLVNIPAEYVRNAELKEGDELKVEVQKHKLTLRKEIKN